MKRHKSPAGGAPAAGSILIEILVAILLLGLAMGPLAAAVETARQRAAEVRRVGEDLSSRASAVASAAWTWGPRVTAAEWLPGQTLGVTVDARIASEGFMGLWADGWFLGELVPESDGKLVVKARSFRLDPGTELTLRVRASGSVWGPPWRSLVPDAIAALEGEMATARLEPAAVGDAARTIIHVPTLANPPFEVSEGTAGIRLEGPGLPVFLTVPDAGPFRVRLDRDEQSWKAEEQRALDLYF